MLREERLYTVDSKGMGQKQTSENMRATDLRFM
jgi:hypothetical protein